MTTATREKERRDSILIILLILLFGFLCIILASGWALRFSPTWRAFANMNSNLDPNQEFIDSQVVNNYVVPLDPDILTKPAWLNVFLTPNAVFSTGTPPPSKTPTTPPTFTPRSTNTSAATFTAFPTFPQPSPVATSTATSTVTNTPIPVIPPTSTNTPVPVVYVDLSITKTDGNVMYTPGSAITYTIVVSNVAGPSNATGASVADTIPASITGVTINCVPTGTASCGINVSAGNNLSYTGVDISAGAGNFLTITVNGIVSPTATGNLVNTATVNAGGGQTDSNLANNTAADTDAPNAANLSITKTDGSATYIAGNPISYTIVVGNAGPSNATGASVADTIPASITGVTINCVATGTASCGTNASAGNNLSYTGVNVAAGAGNFLTITVNGTVNPATTGNLVNTAMVSAGSPPDPVAGNNSATDTDTPNNADLSITITDNATAYISGLAVQYTIVASNAGPVSVTNATVTGTFSTELTNITWTCAGSGVGASCVASGNGNILDTVNLPAGMSVTYTVKGTVVASPAGPTMDSAAQISITGALPVGVSDPNSGNNNATDSDALVVPQAVPPGLEVGAGPNGSIYNLTSGSYLTLALTTTVNGHASWDLVYYENPGGSGVLLDWMIVQIGDGQNWYTVFNWWDNVADTNSNMNFNILPPPTIAPFPPPEELDQRDIPTSSLYNGTGIGIDLDGVVPPGTYNYIRFFAPSGDTNGFAEIDAIQTLP